MEEAWIHSRLLGHSAREHLRFQPLGAFCACLAWRAVGRFRGLWFKVGKLGKEVEPEGQSGAWKKFGPICSCSPAVTRAHWMPPPWCFLCLLGAAEDSWMLLQGSSSKSRKGPKAGRGTERRGSGAQGRTPRVEEVWTQAGFHPLGVFCTCLKQRRTAGCCHHGSLAPATTARRESRTRRWSQRDDQVLARSLVAGAAADQRAQEVAGCSPLGTFFLCLEQRRTVLGPFRGLLVQTRKARQGSGARGSTRRLEEVWSQARSQEQIGHHLLGSACAC